ncbi:hypothetical protein [Nocardioides aurantiacus]|uniref:Uncharacterized protein n=1 Tax=Nocardioides aurantiacus TaxID=86796 RepID=A0A3N2CTP0_9ACTN|nr:hypothetical protein [Nocardioides aurantiacus]ROR90902.1 hypothetical protein EDD33_1751 [Nocardioides aurantiacus]
MLDQAVVPDPLSPSLTEVLVNCLAMLDVALVVVVLVQLLRGKVTLPHGVIGLIMLLCVPVAGPLLVLTWQDRVARNRARPHHTHLSWSNAHATYQAGGLLQAELRGPRG